MTHGLTAGQNIKNQDLPQKSGPSGCHADTPQCQTSVSKVQKQLGWPDHPDTVKPELPPGPGCYADLPFSAQLLLIPQGRMMTPV